MSLRVAIFVGMFPVISETFILRQITGLMDLGHDIHIFSDLRNDPSVPAQPEVAQYKLLERTTFMDMPVETAPYEMPVRPFFGKTWPPGSSVPVSNLRRLLHAFPQWLTCVARCPGLSRRVLSSAEYGYQAASLSALYRLAKLAGSNRSFDVLHAHFGPIGNSFRFARELWQAPLVVSFHGYDFSTLPRREGQGMYRQLFATVDAVTVNSNYTRQEVEKLGCPSAKVYKLPVGLDPAAFPFHERVRSVGEPVRLLTVARLVEIKGHEYVIRAVAQLRDQNLPIQYDIVGDGPLRKKLAELIRDLGLENCVILHGAQPGPAIQKFLHETHLFVLASVNVEGDQEGQGLVLQEAQACGIPVLATQHGALPEGLLSGQSGWLVPERDVDALAERLRWFVEHPKCWPTMGQSGRIFVEKNYNVHHLNARLAELYGVTIGEFSRKKARPLPGKD
jgi:colanic acid/amylovoran biosynthesis glycosyltransferase